MEVNVESGEQGQAEQGGGAAEFDISPVLDQVTKLGESLGERLDGFEQRLPEQQQQEYQRNDLGQFAGNPDPYGQQPGAVPPNGQQQPGPQYDEYGELTPEAAQAQLQQMLNPMLGPMQQQMQQMAEQNARLTQTMQELEMDRGAEHLEQKYPELQEEQAANALVAQALQVAQQMGSPDLVGRTGFLELVHKAQRADAAASSETAATPGPSLEPAGGASLAGTEPTIQDRIKAAGGVQNSVWRV